MSAENVEIVRSAWDAWQRGDLPGILSHFAPEIVWDTSHYHDWPEPAYHGPEGVERFLSEFLAVWDDYEVGVEEMLAGPDGRVVTRFWHRGRGRHSGLAMRADLVQIATVRDGKITYIDTYDDRTEGLEAAGLTY
jgi:ketosteroid isomerase-like protein